MSADDFLLVVTQAVLLSIFIVTLVHALRRRHRASIDIAFFFATIVAILIATDIRRLDLSPAVDQVMESAVLVLLVWLPYLTLRIVDDFRPQSRWLTVSTIAVLAVLIVLSIAGSPPRPTWFLLLLGAWFLGLGGYVTAAFVRGSREGAGVTARRMLSAAAGSGLIAGAVLVGILGAIVPAVAEPALLVTRLAGLGAAIAYFIAFSTPSFLRRAWQEPELRAFLGRSATLPRLPETDAIVRELEHGAASSTGAAHAVIGLWNEQRRTLTYRGADGTIHELPDDEFIGGRAFTAKRAVFAGDASRADPEHASTYLSGEARAVLAAPISAGGNRIGVLCVYAERAPIFAEDDLELLQLLADQAAVILESRRLIDYAAQVKAREEATRLKDEFLSAAAHDLRTPLTTLLLQAQMLERQVAADSPEGRRVAVIHSEAMRLRNLVTDYLDASRAERGELVGRRLPADLAAIARQACERHSTPRHPCQLEGDGQVAGEFDVDRVGQLLDNLIGNAVKYSPGGGAIAVRTWTEDGNARLSVTDNGIGIPAEDVAQLFDRFQRGSNVDDRRFQGIGLGLYICRGIVDQHGGRIWVESQLGAGSTFHVELPLRERDSQPAAPEPTADERHLEPAGPDATHPAGAPANG